MLNRSAKNSCSETRRNLARHPRSYGRPRATRQATRTDRLPCCVQRSHEDARCSAHHDRQEFRAPAGFRRSSGRRRHTDNRSHPLRPAPRPRPRSSERQASRNGPRYHHGRRARSARYHPRVGTMAIWIATSRGRPPFLRLAPQFQFSHTARPFPECRRDPHETEVMTATDARSRRLPMVPAGVTAAAAGRWTPALPGFRSCERCSPVSCPAALPMVMTLHNVVVLGSGGEGKRWVKSGSFQNRYAAGGSSGPV